MKKTFFAVTMAALAWAEMGWAQGALHTDPAGNPVGALNLGGSNVVGTLAVDRLPAGAKPPVVQTISQTQGNVTLGAGTNVAVLGGALTGELHLALPAAASYPAGRTLAVVDPGGYSSEGAAVTAAPAGTDTLNGGTAALIVLSGTGAASLTPDGAGRWIAGQSRLNVPTNQGLVLAGPGSTEEDRVLSVRGGSGLEAFGVRGDDMAWARNLTVDGVWSSDNGNLSTSGEGDLGASGNVVAAGVYAYFHSLRAAREAGDFSVTEGQATLFFGTDGKLHCVTYGGVDHVLTWTTP